MILIVYVCMCVCLYVYSLSQTENFLIISEHVFLQDIQRIQIVNSCQKNLIKKIFFLVKRYKNNRLFGLLCDCKEMSIRVTNNVI